MKSEGADLVPRTGAFPEFEIQVYRDQPSIQKMLPRPPASAQPVRISQPILHPGPPGPAGRRKTMRALPRTRPAHGPPSPRPGRPPQGRGRPKPASRASRGRWARGRPVGPCRGRVWRVGGHGMCPPEAVRIVTIQAGGCYLYLGHFTNTN